MLTVGVDVGGTSIKSALISVEEGRYTILQSFSTPTQGDKGAEIIVGNIVKAIKHFDLSKVDKIESGESAILLICASICFLHYWYMF